MKLCFSILISFVIAVVADIVLGNGPVQANEDPTVRAFSLTTAELAVDLTTLLNTGGLFAQPVDLGSSQLSSPFSCSAYLFSPNVTNIKKVLPDFTFDSSQGCSPLSLGLGMGAHSCRWNQQTFLGMLYDRGIELSRYRIRQGAAFQTYDHARVMLYQYQVCNQTYPDNTVSIPMSVENVYGLVLGHLFARNSGTLNTRTPLSLASENTIGQARSYALSVAPGKTYSVGWNFGAEKIQALESSTDWAPTSDLVARSATNPVNDADCNAANPASNVWEYYQYPFSPLVDPLQNCCARACSSLLHTVGVSPTMLMMSTCCGACNLYNCVPASATSTSAMALMTVISVPSLLNGYVTTVNMTL